VTGPVTLIREEGVSPEEDGGDPLERIVKKSIETKKRKKTKGEKERLPYGRTLPVDKSV